LLNVHQIILRKFILTFFTLFLFLGLIIYFWLKDFYLEQTKDSLLNNIKILSHTIQTSPNLDTLAQNIKNELNLRLTLIGLDGEIIAESHKDKTKMENHLYRDEILESNNQEYGYKIRHSNTLNKDFLYIVKKYNNKQKSMYIRLSKEIDTVYEHIILLGKEITILLFLFFIAIFFITYKLSKTIEAEVQKIANFLTSLTKKNKETYINSNLSVEFQSITSLLTKVSQILVKKEKQKTKFTTKLQISNKQKDDIISAISHEFKNPIAVINGYSQTLLDDADINPNIRYKFLKKIYKNGLKLSELIDTLRLSTKLDSGQQEMNFKKIYLYELVQETVENITLNYPKREVIIKGEHHIVIKGDASLFSVVLTNLIENAFKYSEDEVIIEFNTSTISVLDSGIGISQKNIENLTSKFFRVNENSWNNSLGLGLFIVSNILKLHHFTLKIESQENEGSKFSVKF